MQAEGKDELPVLPEPAVRCGEYAGPPGEGASENFWDSDQMHAYAREAVATATSKLAELQREVEGLRKDAERWRFYDKHANDWIEDHQLGNWLQRPGLWKHGSRNAAIDAAMSGRSGSGEVSNG